MILWRKVSHLYIACNQAGHEIAFAYLASGTVLNLIPSSLVNELNHISEICWFAICIRHVLLWTSNSIPPPGIWLLHLLKDALVPEDLWKICEDIWLTKAPWDLFLLLSSILGSPWKSHSLSVWAIRINGDLTPCCTLPPPKKKVC